MRWRDLSRLFGGGRRHHRAPGFGRAGMMGGAARRGHAYGGGGGMGGPMARDGGDMDTSWMPFVVFILVLAVILLKIILDKVNKNKNGGSTPGRNGRPVNTAPPQRLGTANDTHIRPQHRRPWMAPAATGCSASDNASTSANRGRMYPHVAEGYSSASDNAGTSGSRSRMYPNVAEVERSVPSTNIPSGTVRGGSANQNEPPAVMGPPEASPAESGGGPRRRRKFAQLEEISAQKGKDYGIDYVDPTGNNNVHHFEDENDAAPAVPHRVLGPPEEEMNTRDGEVRNSRHYGTNETREFGHGYGSGGSSEGTFDKGNAEAHECSTYPVGPTAPVESDIEEETAEEEHHEETAQSSRGRTTSQGSEIDPEPDLR